MRKRLAESWVGEVEVVKDDMKNLEELSSRKKRHVNFIKFQFPLEAVFL